MIAVTDDHMRRKLPFKNAAEISYQPRAIPFKPARLTRTQREFRSRTDPYTHEKRPSYTDGLFLYSRYLYAVFRKCVRVIAPTASHSADHGLYHRIEQEYRGDYRRRAKAGSHRRFAGGTRLLTASFGRGLLSRGLIGCGLRACAVGSHGLSRRSSRHRDFGRCGFGGVRLTRTAFKAVFFSVVELCSAVLTKHFHHRVYYILQPPEKSNPAFFCTKNLIVTEKKQRVKNQGEFRPTTLTA